MSDSENSRIIFAILTFLNEEFNKVTTSSDNKESLEVAMQCLETAFGVTINHTHLRGPKTLREMFNEGNANQQPTLQAQAQNLNSATNQLDAIETRLGEVYRGPSEPISDEVKVGADEFKNQGNDKMKEGMYNDALSLYSKAIEMDGGNAVYFCNRAATYLKLNMLNEALRDCQIAAQLSPNYARAYGRMGVVYSTMNKHDVAALCYQKAIDLEPGNESYVNNLRVAREMITEASGGMGMGMGGAGGGPNFQNILNNPNLVNMAGQMLQDPQMQNLMRNIMTGFQNSQTEGNPNFDTFLQMGQAIANQIRTANPNLAEQLHGFNPQDPSSGGGAGGGGQNQ